MMADQQQDDSAMTTIGDLGATLAQEAATEMQRQSAEIFREQGMPDLARLAEPDSNPSS